MVEGSNVNTSFEQLRSGRLQVRDVTRLAVRPNIFIPCLLFLAALALFIPRLGVPNQYIYDEVYHAYTAGQYAAGNPDAYVWYTQPAREGVGYTWNHPPLGLLFHTLGIRIWGDNSFGWRFFSTVFGAICVVVAYFLALSLTSRKLTAFLAAGLLLLDGLFFVQSRTSMLDIFGTTFMLGAFIALHRYLTAPIEKAHLPLILVGVCIGLAIATKWNAAYASAIIAVAVGWHTLRMWRERQRSLTSPRSRKKRRLTLTATVPVSRLQVKQHILWLPVALIVVPGLVYLLSYVPFFLTGHSPAQFVELQKQIYYYHSNLTATHGYQSQWWSWIFALRPVWYYVSYGQGTIANIYANGNPLLYWAFLPAVVWVIYRWWGVRNASLAVFLIGFFGQWLPWALVPRIAFIYHFLPVVPFGCLAIAVALTEMWESAAGWRLAALAYVGLVVLSFVFFFPIYSAIPLSTEAFESRLWLQSWR